MKKITFTIILVAAQAVFSQQGTTSKYNDLIIGLWNDYIIQVDDKNIEGMFNYFKLPLVLHFNTDDAHNIKTREEFEEIFNTWKKSSKADFHRTKREAINVSEVIDDFLCIADVVYKRLDSNDQVIKLERALYHYMNVEGEWKIYMISNVDSGSQADIKAAQQARIDKHTLERAYRRGVLGSSVEHKRVFNEKIDVGE